jgi:hypothetical protein
MTRRMAFALALLLGAALSACTGIHPGPSPEIVSATGIVLRVDGQGAVDVSSFVLRTDDGRQLTFEVGRLDGGLLAEHLREHLRSGEPIEVEYYRATGGDGLVAVRYTDAPEDSVSP